MDSPSGSNYALPLAFQRQHEVYGCPITRFIVLVTFMGTVHPLPLVVFFIPVISGLRTVSKSTMII